MNTQLTQSNALFGAIAIQLGLASPEPMRQAFAECARSERPLDVVLEERGQLTGSRSEIDAIVRTFRGMHGGDVARALEFLAKRLSDASALGPELFDCLFDTLEPPVSDPEATESFSPRLPSPSILRASEHTSRYEKTTFLDRGGLGEVWLARDRELDRTVALKEIRADRHSISGTRMRFVAESEITARLEHPGIVPVYGAGKYPDGRPFYAMRLISGSTLKAAIDAFHSNVELQNDVQLRAAELRKLLRRFTDVCNAVAFAHSRGVLHRDLKPQNIMLGAFGETLVLDWGLAKQQFNTSDLDANGSSQRPVITDLTDDGLVGMTAHDAVLGTLPFMSPEQARGESATVTAASDVYGLGATLYYLLAGIAPFDGAKATREAVAAGKFPGPRHHRPWISKALEAICLKAMAHAPANRYTNGTELAADIDRWLADDSVGAYSDPIITKLRRWAKRHRVLVNTLVSAALIGGVALIITTVRVNAERNRAELRFGQARRAVDDNLLQITDDPYLRAPGLRTLREGLLKRGLTYYASFVQEKSEDSHLLGVTAGAKLRAAIIQQEMGDAKLASNSYAEAFPLYVNLLKQTNPEPQWRLDLARGRLKHGDLLATAGASRDEALASYKDALALIKSMTGDADNREVRILEASVHNSLGRWQKSSNANAALAECQTAVELFEDLGREFPEDPQIRRELAQSLIHIATLRQEVRQLDKAKEAYEHSQAEWQKLDGPGQAGIESRTAQGRILHDLGVLNDLLGDSKAASVTRARALELRRNVAFTSAYDQMTDLARTCNDYGIQLCDSGQIEQGMELLREARMIRERLAEVTNKSLRERIHLLESYHNEARVHITHRGKLGENSLADGEKFLAQARQMISANRGDEAAAVEVVMHRGWNSHLAGYLEMERQNFDAAELALVDACEIRTGLVNAEPSHPQRIQDLIFSQLMIGNVALLRKEGRTAIERYKVALASADRLVALRPDDRQAQTLQATIVHSLAKFQFSNREDPRVVVESLELAISRLKHLLPVSRDQLEQAYVLLWQVSLQTKNIERAAAAAKEISSLFPEDPKKLVEVAGRLTACFVASTGDEVARQGYAEDAIKSLTRAVELEFSDVAVLESSAFAPLEALEAFQSLVNRVRENKRN